MTRKFQIYLTAFLAVLTWLGKPAEGSDLNLAETAGNLRTWHVTDGLPSDSVTAILQTRDGFLLVGTTAGLVRFDGIKFTGISLGTADMGHAVCVTALCEDSDGCLWIGTQEAGLFQLAQGQLRHFDRKQGLLDDGVTSLASDKRGQVWIGSKLGLNLWTGQHFQSFTKSDGLSDDFVSGVNVARSGIVWIATRTGTFRFVDGHIQPYLFKTESQGRSPEYLGTYEDRRGNLWAFGDTYLINLAEGKRFNYFRSSDSASLRIWSLCEGEDGRIWIGTSGRGLFCFEGDRFKSVILGESRWPYDVRVICEDGEGNLWLGTSGGGLLQLRPQSVSLVPVKQGMPASPPTTIALDGNGRIYVGLQRGGLIFGEFGRFDRVVGTDGSVIQNCVSSVSMARDGTLWAGTLGDGLYGLKGKRVIHFTTANGLADDDVLAMCVDAAGDLWASTGAGTVHRFAGRVMDRYDTTSGLPGASVTVMIPSPAGGLWLGSAAGQILREQNGKISTIEGLKSLQGFPVLALYEGKNGRLWIGTSGGGLACLVGGAMVNWNTSNGLPSSLIAGAMEDPAKNLWLVTGAGIYRVNSSDVIKSLNHPGSLLECKLMSSAKIQSEPAPIFGGTHVAQSSDGQLWFATSDGVLNTDTRLSKNAPARMPLYLESAVCNGRPPFSLLRGGPWSMPDTNTTPWKAPADLRALEIHFTALNFAAPAEVRFRHKLVGFDSDWVDDGESRFARYGRLPHGRYNFHIAARTADGPWQEAAETFAFVVPTPIYLQTWAIGLFVLAVVALVAGIVRLVSHRRLRFDLASLEQQQSLERERMRIARDMHDEMGSKLTKISFLSEHAQVDAGAVGPLAEKIESIAQTSRELLQTMDEIVWVVNPRNDTLENLVAYLGHYAVEYFSNTQIECEIRLPQETPHYSLSSEMRHNLFLTFEEVLNNVLKHSGATKVKVQMTITAEECMVRITDDGRGFAMGGATAELPPRGGRGGNGLKNMRQRLADVGGECLIASRPGSGTSVTMLIRLNSKAQQKP